MTQRSSTPMDETKRRASSAKTGSREEGGGPQLEALAFIFCAPCAMVTVYVPGSILCRVIVSKDICQQADWLEQDGPAKSRRCRRTSADVLDAATSHPAACLSGCLKAHEMGRQSDEEQRERAVRMQTGRHWLRLPEAGR
jgi:hypothetical protein